MQDLLNDHEESWATHLRNDRNDMAHHKGIRLNEQLSEQFFLSESVYWLYVFLLLRLAKAPSGPPVTPPGPQVVGDEAEDGRGRDLDRPQRHRGDGRDREQQGGGRQDRDVRPPARGRCRGQPGDHLIASGCRKAAICRSARVLR